SIVWGDDNVVVDVRHRASNTALRDLCVPGARGRADALDDAPHRAHGREHVRQLSRVPACAAALRQAARRQMKITANPTSLASRRVGATADVCAGHRPTLFEMALATASNSVSRNNTTSGATSNGVAPLSSNAPRDHRSVAS